MHAISLWQPWASLVALGLKRYETRSWSTNYHGPILIHTAKRWSREQKRYHDRFAAIIRDHMPCVSQETLDRFRDEMPLGSLLAQTVLTIVEPTSRGDAIAEWVNELSAAEKAFGDFSIGRYAWLMRGPRLLDAPVPFAGKQRLFVVPDSLVKPACVA